MGFGEGALVGSRDKVGAGDIVGFGVVGEDVLLTKSNFGEFLSWRLRISASLALLSFRRACKLLDKTAIRASRKIPTKAASTSNLINRRDHCLSNSSSETCDLSYDDGGDSGSVFLGDGSFFGLPFHVF